jgi:glycosyltransferase involved in cell wall biosynthesis
MKKRILIISDLPVLPANAGNKTRVYAMMKNLERLGHEVWFLGLGLREEEAAELRKEWGRRVHNLPAQRARHARPRWFALKRFLTDRFIARGIGAPGVDHWYWPHWDKGIADFASRHTFEAVMVEYVFFSRALRHFEPSVCKIIDTHDVYTGRREKLKLRKIKRFYQYLTQASEEARGLNRADVVIGIQENESKFFRQLLGPSKRVITVGHTVDLQPVARPDQADILFLGSAYVVNVDGINHFIKNCFPLIRASVPHARLLIAGPICRVLKPGSPGVSLLGEVANLAEAYSRAAVVVNPVLAGTGLKTKTIEALAFGCPLVTTSCGAEGLEDAAGSAFQQADDPIQMAETVINLLTQPEVAARCAEGATKFIERWNDEQLKVLSQILSNPNEHNPQNPNSDHFSPEPAAEVGDVRIGPGEQLAPV